MAAPCGTEACRRQWDRSLPPPVAETGRRSVGNRKEHRLRCDYASSPDHCPLQGSGAAAPTYPLTSQLSGRAASGARPIFSGEAGCVPGLGGANAGRKRLARNRNSRLRLRCDSCFLWRCALGCVRGFQSGKRNSRAGAPFRFRRSASLHRPGEPA